MDDSTVEKKDRFLPHFGHISKVQRLKFEFSKYESFVTFIMPKYSCDGNFRPFCAFIDFLQMFKIGKFANSFTMH